ncbi:hypothetical protein UNDYM_4291 [Undibacterium sp. YM2]|uniref:hypothetical protein n=1 Tax=Undibacterium sp. YM2 TaxID=2058625 RepID=UPI001331D22C|nr:hypothetical protein [Undibacterium sp. YM2]BBB68544.1 hypothetical protein UNDYM_4291 [Undibacterium sp. YM2]
MMNNPIADQLEKLLRAFSNEHIRDFDSVAFRFEIDSGECKIAYRQKRKVENFQPPAQSQTQIEEFSGLVKQMIAFVCAGKQEPNVVVMDVSHSSSYTKFSYDELHAFSISKEDVGLPNSFYHPSNVILPEQMRRKNKENIVGGRAIKSVWSLVAAADDMRQQQIDPSLARAYLLEEADYAPSELKAMVGLQLTIYEDGSFYDEAIDPGLSVNWFNNDGELNAYHTICHGRVSQHESKLFLLPDIPSFLGPPAESEAGFVRFDDTSTKIVDAINIDMQALSRTISVLTDGIYFCRLYYNYELKSL